MDGTRGNWILHRRQQPPDKNDRDFNFGYVESKLIPRGPQHLGNIKSAQNVKRDPGDTNESSNSEDSDVESNADSEITPCCTNNDSDSGNETEPDIEVHEEDNIPHPKDLAALVHWLQISDAHLAALHTSAAPVCCGAYHNTKIGKDLSVRREQELRKAEKEWEARENQQDLRQGLKKTQIHDFFSRPKPVPSPQIPEPETDPTIVEESPTTGEMDVDSPHGLFDLETTRHIEDPAELTMLPNNSAAESTSRTLTSRVTIEVIDDENEEELTIEPCQLSPEARAEEGLNELHWDPSEDVSPRPNESPLPIQRLPAPLPSPPFAHLLCHPGSIVPPRCTGIHLNESSSALENA
ncbi:hypothetical protein B0H10DRAFT_1948545 [Mycena sp. CBHHK59/15]|nr:hypothetical protein B0H10DRAFT_1948545 [Mycena sp. CBHHK59/15]